MKEMKLKLVIPIHSDYDFNYFFRLPFHSIFWSYLHIMDTEFKTRSWTKGHSDSNRNPESRTFTTSKAIKISHYYQHHPTASRCCNGMTQRSETHANEIHSVENLIVLLGNSQNSEKRLGQSIDVKCKFKYYKRFT